MAAQKGKGSLTVKASNSSGDSKIEGASPSPFTSFPQVTWRPGVKIKNLTETVILLAQQFYPTQKEAAKALGISIRKMRYTVRGK